MDSNVKVLEMIENGSISVNEGAKLLKAMNNNDNTDSGEAEKATPKKKSKKKKSAKKSTKKPKKKAKKKAKKKTAKKAQPKSLVEQKKGAHFQLGPNGELLQNGKPIGEDDSRRPYQKDRDPGR